MFIFLFIIIFTLILLIVCVELLFMTLGFFFFFDGVTGSKRIVFCWIDRWFRGTSVLRRFLLFLRNFGGWFGSILCFLQTFIMFGLSFVHDLLKHFTLLFQPLSILSQTKIFFVFFNLDWQRCFFYLNLLTIFNRCFLFFEFTNLFIFLSFTWIKYWSWDWARFQFLFKTRLLGLKCCHLLLKYCDCFIFLLVVTLIILNLQLHVFSSFGNMIFLSDQGGWHLCIPLC